MAVDPLPVCEHCKEELPVNVLHCRVCGRDAGYPNVRLCKGPKEVAALGKRYAAACADAGARGVADKLSAFEAAIEGSNAVLAMRAPRLIPLVASNDAVVSFYRSVEAGIRSPANDEWDLNRPRNDHSANPYSADDLVFAALSLTDEGVSWYGDFFVTLKSECIDIRTTVFEMNPFSFNKKPRSPKKLPKAGHRATWPDRTKLAVSKLAVKVTAATVPADFQPILLGADHERGDSDFLEVHIYGPIHMRAIAKIYAHPKTDSDRHFWAGLKAKLEGNGAIPYREADDGG